MVETLPLLLDKRKSFFTGRVGDAWDFRHANKSLIVIIFVFPFKLDCLGDVKLVYFIIYIRFVCLAELIFAVDPIRFAIFDEICSCLMKTEWHSCFYALLTNV